jgi:hypothetical protein
VILEKIQMVGRLAILFLSWLVLGLRKPTMQIISFLSELFKSIDSAATEQDLSGESGSTQTGFPKSLNAGFTNKRCHVSKLVQEN